MAQVSLLLLGGEKIKNVDGLKSDGERKLVSLFLSVVRARKMEINETEGER